jgi:glycosyltransferase involved in cell wall biosynthesis
VVDADPRLKERVRFIPRKPFSEMVEVYNNADVAVSIPDRDGAAASVLEAMACEVPVIASDIPSMREWIEEGATGYLTAIDPARLADKMRKAYSVRVMLGPMGRRAREKVLDEKNQGTFESNIRIAEQSYHKLLA